MKKSTPLFILSVVALVGCATPAVSSSVPEVSSPESASSFEPKANLVEKSIATYSVVDIMDPAVSPLVQDPQAWAEHSAKGAKTYYVHPSYPNVLYTTFEGYGALLSSTLPSTYQYSFADNTITVKDDQAKTVFDATLNVDKMQFKINGQLSLGSIGMDIGAIAGSLLAEMNPESNTIIAPEDEYSTIGYEVFARDFDVVVEDNVFYAPLALYDSVFGPSVSAYHIYDFERVVQYNTNFALVLPLGTADGSVSSKLTAYHAKNGMPYDLRLLDKASLYQTFEYHYGLRDHRNIASMSQYFSLLCYDQRLTAENDDERCIAYFDLFAGLEDDHSGVSALADWFGDKKEHLFRGARSNERKILRNSLRAQRNNALGTTPTMYGVDGNVHYSQSGKTAYFYFVHAFEEIKKHGGVENVVIDDSCNGGGTLGIAAKLLALISKNNVSSVHQYDALTHSLTEMKCQVDSNRDGVYDARDVYGDDFNISILTSPVSFSCGNLLPVFAKYKGDAKILGQTSGGGECTVATTYLPSGRSIQYSSNTILCNYDGAKVVRGVERGATPDIELPYYQFYDIDALEAAIAQ